jgi:3-oxoacyl-[acyl-carrier-protein] synthase-1/3-oxoacyl-[acyl-carrier-protein] synthase II
VGGLNDVPVSCIRRDAELVRWGLARPLAARADIGTKGFDRPQALLGGAAELLVRRLDRELAGWRQRRLLVCVGTSAGGMPSFERVSASMARSGVVEPEVARSALYDGPLAALRPWFTAPLVQVLAACASSTLAIGLGVRWLEAGDADLVIAGGYDALSAFVATGFESLGATTGAALTPFRVGRDGMALGEGAALVALARAEDASQALGYVVGFSATSDAVHVTAPDPDGRGLARAARQALEDAGVHPKCVDLVSAHATATRLNDASEARALRSCLGDSSAVIHPFKAVIGHCLGASGALETLSALKAIDAGVLPASLGEGPVEPDLPGELLGRNRAGVVRACLKLSAGFGGANAALVLATMSGTAGRPRSRRPCAVLSVGELVEVPSLPSLAPFRAVDEARIERLSSGGALVATAAVSALRALGRLPGDRVGVVVGTTAACLDENERFERARREKGPRAVEPRRFSRTSPNVPAGECAIALGFTGPAFAVGGGVRAPIEALLVAASLVGSGELDYAVVVVCDEIGPATRALFEAARSRFPAPGARAVVVGVRNAAGPVLDRGVLVEMLAAEHSECGDGLLQEALSRAARS